MIGLGPVRNLLLIAGNKPFEYTREFTSKYQIIRGIRGLPNNFFLCKRDQTN